MTGAWSNEEIEAIVADYFEMLSAELKGKNYNKTQHRRQLSRFLQSRSEGSIERKHQNISAILIELGAPYIAGYKPLVNYQRALKDPILRHVADPEFQRLVCGVVDRKARYLELPNILNLEDMPPERQLSVGRMHNRVAVLRETTRSPINFLEREMRNSSLGEAGEQFAVSFEKARLTAAGRDSLADSVEQVSKTQGPAVGYDIHSYELDGKDRMIEVKTTGFGKDTPFYVSKNEVETSVLNDKKYYLYRVFLLRDDPHFYKLRGRIDEACKIDPVQFLARL